MMDWLLVIDMQPGFGHGDSPWCTPGYDSCAERIDQLLPRFQDRVLFTRFVPPSQPVGAWVAYYAQWSFAVQDGADWLWEVDARWRAYPSVTSHRFAKWQEAAVLLPQDARINMCGVATDCCVLGTAVEAVDAGRQIRLIEDACAAGTPALHHAAVTVMADRAPMLSVTTTDQILSGA